MRGQPRKGGSGSLLTGCLPVPVQLVFAEERDLKVDLFTLSPLLFFFFFKMNGRRCLFVETINKL